MLTLVSRLLHRLRSTYTELFNLSILTCATLQRQDHASNSAFQRTEGRRWRHVYAPEAAAIDYIPPKDLCTEGYGGKLLAATGLRAHNLSSSDCRLHFRTLDPLYIYGMSPQRQIFNT